MIELFLRLLEDADSRQLSRAAGALGTGKRVRRVLQLMRRSIERILVKPLFKQAFELGAKAVTIATQIPLPTSPRGLQTTIAQVIDPCAAAATMSTAAVAPATLVGYDILRSSSAISATSPRIGFVPATTTAFVDTTPMPGTYYYGIVAMYEDGDSLPTTAPPIVVQGRQRSVRH